MVRKNVLVKYGKMTELGAMNRIAVMLNMNGAFWHTFGTHHKLPL
jgi:hypothetical protein